MDAHLTSSEGEGGSKLQGGGKKMAGQGQGQGKVSPRTSRQPSVFAFWRPEGPCMWADTAGRKLTLSPVAMVTLCDKERQVLQMVAMATLQAMKLGLHLPKLKNFTDPFGERSKRGAISLKVRSVRNALIQGLKKDRSSKQLRRSVCLDNNASSAQVFGVSLARVTARESGHDLGTGGRGGGRRSGGGGGGGRMGGAGSTPRETIDLLRLRSKRKSSTSSGDALSCDDSLSESDASGALLEALSLSTPMQSADGASTSQLSEEDYSLTWHEPLVPRIVTICCSHIREHGLHQLGIFRVGSSKKRVSHLREEFDSGGPVSLGPGSDTSIHDVAALLKEYCRDLPDPLFTRDLYSAFVATRKISSRDQRITVLQLLVALLPRPNGDTLWTLLAFLNTVAQHSADTTSTHTAEIQPGNKMDSHNLATIFAPNLLHKAKGMGEFEVEQAERAEESADVIAVVQEMIDSCDELFQVSAALHDEVLRKLSILNSDALDHLLNIIVATNRTGFDANQPRSKSGSDTSLGLSSPPLRGLTRKRREEFFTQRSGSLTTSLLPQTMRASSPSDRSCDQPRLGNRASSPGEASAASLRPSQNLPVVSIVTEMATSSEEDATENLRHPGGLSADLRRLRTAHALASPSISRRLLRTPAALAVDDTSPLPSPGGPKTMTLAVPTSGHLGGSNSSLSSGYCPGSSRSGTCSPVSPLASPAASWSLSMANSPQMTVSRELSPIVTPSRDAIGQLRGAQPIPQRFPTPFDLSAAASPHVTDVVAADTDANASASANVWMRLENLDAAHETDIMF